MPEYNPLMTGMSLKENIQLEEKEEHKKFQDIHKSVMQYRLYLANKQDLF
jgi:hypothetical protein